jgi:chromatin segregation and condensation protein Rec8/ScpA/Scc1 (kleisin family)
VNLTQLDLDLDVFQGPFDLLLALVMREEIELAEVPIAEIVVAYVERAYDDGELDLESASEFLVLIAALLEIKVRMLFPGEEDEEGDGMSAEEAEAELLARLIEYKRYAAAAAWSAPGPHRSHRARRRSSTSSPRTPGSFRSRSAASSRPRPRSTSPPSAAGSCP